MKAKKHFGQHFLRDASVVDAIIGAAEVEGADVLEIGPGEGVLTTRLVELAKRVVAIDIDDDAVREVGKRIDSDKLELVLGDVLDGSKPDVRGRFDSDFVLVGNLPYNITSDLLRWMLASEPKPERAVIMVQKEVGERMMADKGDMSMLGLMSQMYSNVSRVVGVPRDAFSPPPKVDSVVLKLDLYSQEDLDARGVKDPEKILRFANVAFSKKRKQLKSTLTGLPDVSSEALEAALKELGHPETARPQELSTDDWIQLYGKLHGYCV